MLGTLSAEEGNPMNKKLRLLLALSALFLISSLGDAKPTVKCDVFKVSEHQLLVTFEWRVSIFSDKAWDGCDLRISFQDNKGQEVYFVKEILKLKVGQNEFSGSDICNRDVWKRVAKYLTTLDCQF
jgi:hypothetical protein